MKVDPLVFLTIIGMAIATYLTRAGGFWLMSRFEPSERLERGLRAIPAAILISIVAPSVITSGPQDVLAVIATAVTAWRTKSPLIAMTMGVLTIIVIRQIA